MQTPPHRSRRFLLALLLAWPVISSLAGASQVLTNRRTSADGWANTIAFEIAANSFHLASFPFRVILALAGVPVSPISWPAALALHGGVWAILLAAIAFLARRRAPRHERPAEPALAARRVFLARATGAGVALAATATTAKAVALDPWSIKLRRYTIPIRDLPPLAAGFRIVQLSDTHAGPRVPPAHIAAAVELARSLDPDLFALTGDYVLDSPRFIPLAIDLFKPLTANPGRAIGTVAVLGNHDWYADAPRLARDLSAIGLRMLDNDRLFLDPAARTLSPTPSPGALCIAGLGDLMQHVVEPAAALRDVPLDMPRIVLAHHPDTAELPEVKAKDPARRIDLMLSGHTHGGQVRLPFLGTPIVPSNFGQKYAGGLVQGPSFPVIVSRGVGLSILPVRLAVPPEVVEITLIPA